MSDLFYTGEAIRCRGCEREFEIYGRSNPEQLVIAMERIAASHECRPVRQQRPQIRVWTTPTGRQLNVYYTKEMQRLSA